MHESLVTHKHNHKLFHIQGKKQIKKVKRYTKKVNYTPHTTKKIQTRTHIK